MDLCFAVMSMVFVIVPPSVTVFDRLSDIAFGQNGGLFIA